MKKLLMLVMVFLVCLSVFSIPGPLVKAETINPSSTTGLYAGSTNPGKVWEYKGGTSWESITDQPSELGWSVTSIIEFEGKLYAATISNPDSYSSTGKVYRYEGGKMWTPVVSGLAVNQVTFLVVYEGNLYAGTATPARLYKYEPATASWTKVLEYGSWFGFRSAYVWGDWLYLGEWYYDRFARWDGVNFQIFQPYYWGSCIYSFEEYGDYLYAGAYGGRIYRVTYEPPTATSIWSPPQWQYAWTLKAFKNKLYIGFDAGGTGSAPLYKYDGNLETVYDIPVWNYAATTSNPHEGIISMVTDETYLYIGVGGQAVGYPTFMSGEGTGRVYRYDGVNSPVLISNNLGTGVQTLYYIPQLPSKPVLLGEFYLTAYYCVYNNQIEGTQTYTNTIADKRAGHQGEQITLTLKASFWFGYKGVAQQGIGREEALGLYIDYEVTENPDERWVEIGGPGWTPIKKRYEELGITDFTGFGGWALSDPKGARYGVVDDVRGAYGEELVPWYSVAAPLRFRDKTGYIQFTTGETLTPPKTPSGKTWMSFKVDDTGGAFIERGGVEKRVLDVYLGEGEQALSKWYYDTEGNPTGGNRRGLVYVYVIPPS